MKVHKKRSRHTESQTVGFSEEADSEVPVSAIWRNHGISQATCYKRRLKCGELDASELAGVKEPESENSRLRSMVAELALKNEAILAELKSSSAV